MSRLDYSRQKPLTRDDLVELGHAMTEIANRELGVECGGRVICYTNDNPVPSALAWWPHARSHRDRIDFGLQDVRLKLPSVEALRQKDVDAPGLIELQFRPLNSKGREDLSLSFASLATRSDRTSITAHVCSEYKLSSMHFLPLYKAWKAQARRELPGWQQPFHLARTVMNMYKAMKPYAQP